MAGWKFVTTWWSDDPAVAQMLRDLDRLPENDPIRLTVEVGLLNWQAQKTSMLLGQVLHERRVQDGIRRAARSRRGAKGQVVDGQTSSHQSD